MNKWRPIKGTAYTADELRHELITQIDGCVLKWAGESDVTSLERTEGVVGDVLGLLDDLTYTLLPTPTQSTSVRYIKKGTVLEPGRFLDEYCDFRKRRASNLLETATEIAD